MAKKSPRFAVEQAVPVEKISIQADNKLFQGDTLEIKVGSHQNLINPYFLFKNKKINLYKKADGFYYGLLGLDAYENTGVKKITLKDSSGYLSATKTFSICAKNFPRQNIVLSGSKGGLSATAEELRKISLAKSLQTPVSYWSTRPFINPTNGCIISTYGLSRYYNGVRGSFHKGLDVKAPQGQSIVATSAGKVVVAQQFRLNGGTVAIDHGQGVVSMYLHMSKISVKNGEMVKGGQKIGEVGSTGIATGPHLHWGLYINGIPVNPFSFWLTPVNKC